MSHIMRLFVAAIAIASCAPGAVRAWQDSFALTTYIEGDPDPNPQFAMFGGPSPNYPYPVRKNFTQQKRIQNWRRLNLENEYLHCRVLPDLGGHLYSCLDKRNGKELFYANPVIKKADIGLRGAWVALGIESNFPAGHSRQTVSPVDFALRTNPDGSASAWVGAIDRASGMQWRVEYVLHPGSTVLEQRVNLYNRSAARRPYYWWANAAVAFDDRAMRFVIPANALKAHGRAEISAWPVNAAGVDMSVVSNHQDQDGWFALGCDEPFFGIYKPASRSGVAHFAGPDVVPGKKIWYWGKKGDEYVRTDLTDNFPSYVEIQAGVFRDQDTVGFLQPEQELHFSEYWIPVYDLGGISRVTRDAVVNLERKAARVAIEIGSTHEIGRATIRVLQNGAAIFGATADLSPSTVYRHTVESAADGAYTIQVLDANKAILVEHTEGAYKTTGAGSANAPRAEAKPSAQSESFWLEKLARDDREQQWRTAQADSQAALEKFPESVALGKAAGRLAFELDRFEEALGILGRMPSDDETAYYLGTSQAMLERDAESRQTLEQVLPGSEFGAAASLQIALAAARAKDWDAALARLKRVASIRARGLEIAILRHAGRKAESARVLSEALMLDPTDSLLRFEAVIVGIEDAELWAHLASDAERVLDLVDEYLALGFSDDALRLLRHSYTPVDPARLEPGAIEASKSALIGYYRAYCEQLAGSAGIAEMLRAAGQMPLRYAFPYRPSTFRVLQSLLHAAPSDAAMHFLLSRVLMKRQMVDEAVAELRKSIAAKPSIPEASSDLARLMRELKIP